MVPPFIELVAHSVSFMFEPNSIFHFFCSNNGHMIRFDFYDSDSSYQCHFNALGSFVVSIAHYMRAHFNKQALLYGSDFALPEDAGYLNVSCPGYFHLFSFSVRASFNSNIPLQCVMLQETEYASRKLYAKIGCMQRETFTSTKLQLHVYQDAQCSIPYDDGETNKRHTSKGYEINGYYLSTRVSFRPAFYSCQTCNPDGVAETFNKKTGNWYDDDYITTHGKKTNTTSNDDGNKAEEHINDDAYFYSNDDVASNDDARYNANVGDGSDDHQASQTQYAHNDDYSAGDDRRVLRFIDPNVNNLPTMSAVPESLAVSCVVVTMFNTFSCELFHNLINLLHHFSCMKLNSGAKSKRDTEHDLSTKTIMMSATGTCAIKSTSMAFGVIMSANH